jgi:Domain of unknown function (DUF4148)
MQVAAARHLSTPTNTTQGTHIMNTKHILAAFAIALSGSTAFATEYTEFKDTPSTASRASVKAELARAKAAGELTENAQTYGSFQAKAFTSMRDRAAVRSEGVMAVHQHGLNQLYVGA